MESAFPYPAQLRHFDDAKLGSLVPEHAARYFGDAVYGRETEPVPYYSEWAQSVVRPFNANLRDLAASHCRRVVKAWRGYGMSALGDFPGARDMMLTARTFDRQNVVWSRSSDVKTAGLKPDCPEGDSETQRHLLTDYSLPDYLRDVVREAYAPLLVFLAGDPKDFTNKDHAYFAGERVVKGVVAVNDHTTPRRLDYRWRLLADGEVVARGECAFDVAAGGNGGVVCGAAIKRPSRGNFRTLVACGFDLASAALLEYRRAHGLALFCQLDVTAPYAVASNPYDGDAFHNW